jgi:hypothetical protein
MTLGRRIGDPSLRAGPMPEPADAPADDGDEEHETANSELEPTRHPSAR